ncbi:MAG TPA: hypothetical protein VLE22_16880 [Bryobacteraceae bacterium]|nr:hypothetical protein [Bryobacteraceae bacterium]
MRKRLAEPIPLHKLAPPMEIQVAPKRDFQKQERFNPFLLAGQESGFEMFHGHCGGHVELKIQERVRRLLSLPIATKQWLRFVCTTCSAEYKVELTGRQDLSDECSFAQQCLRRALTEKQGSYGSTAHLSFSYRKP